MRRRLLALAVGAAVPGVLAAPPPSIPASAAVPAAPVDRTELERARIIGNRELPKVLYIVPWKKPQPAPLAGRPAVSVLDEPARPLERAVLRRELRYQSLLRDANPSPSPESPLPGEAR